MRGVQLPAEPEVSAEEEAAATKLQAIQRGNTARSSMAKEPAAKLLEAIVEEIHLNANGAAAHLLVPVVHGAELRREDGSEHGVSDERLAVLHDMLMAWTDFPAAEVAEQLLLGTLENQLVLADLALPVRSEQCIVQTHPKHHPQA